MIEKVEIIDPFAIRKSLVIPLPGNRALRIGFGLETWCRIGPRKYNVIISDEAMQQLLALVPETDEREKILAEIHTLGGNPFKGKKL